MDVLGAHLGHQEIESGSRESLGKHVYQLKLRAYVHWCEDLGWHLFLNKVTIQFYMLGSLFGILSFQLDGLLIDCYNIEVLLWDDIRQNPLVESNHTISQLV